MNEQTAGRPVAVITGASGGIGEAFAYELARDGYRLVLIARDNEELNRVAGVITSKLDVPTIAIPQDLCETDAAATIFAELQRRDIVPDILVNNAGFGIMGAATERDLAEQLSMIDLNVRTTTELSLRFGRQMRSRGRGGIINVSSVAGYLPGPKMAIYYATKAYITSFTEALAHELRPFGVMVTVVCPGITRTDFQRRAGLENTLLMKSSPPMTPEQVARIGYAGHKKGRRRVITGAHNYFTAFSSIVMPNSILMAVINRLHK
jgi:hypothetical protein